MLKKIDLHVHSIYSNDSSITPKELVFYAKKQGLDGIAVTDHNRLDSAVKLAKKTDFLIIPGIEISSLNGHIIGLCVTEPIPQRLSVEETLEKIHESDGIAIACHPTTLTGNFKKYITPKFDAVEVINASVIPFKYAIKENQKIATRLRLSCVGGSDAHYGPEIGYAYTEINSELNIDDIINALKNGQCKPFGKQIPLTMRLKRKIVCLQKKLSK